MCPDLDRTRVDAALAGTVFAGKLHHFARTESTQAYALRDAQAGAGAGQVYVADEQTAGRGRGGHAWHSEPGSGLYLTVLVRPKLPAERILEISLATGLAAHAAIVEAGGTDVDLRWPNDLVSRTDGRKLGGILTETASDANGVLRHAAIGIGINLNQTEFPEELARTATSLRMESGEGVQREALLIALLRRLHAELGALEEVPSRVLERFAATSSWVRGKRVQVAETAATGPQGDGYTGVTRGLTPAGLLRVALEDGTERIVRHGGVRAALRGLQRG